MTRHVGKVLLALVLALTPACAASKVSLRDGPREYVPTDYEDVSDNWTRSGDLITLSQLSSLLRATATFESWDFRWAYVIRYVEDYRLTLDQRRKLLDKTLEETETGHHFFIAITGGERRFNDLTKPDSAWIVRLIDSTGNEIAPDEITAIKKPNVLERAYYPYITVFHRAFRVRFPRFNAEGKPTISEDAEWFGLRFAGAQGSSELTWEIDKDLPGQPKLKSPESGKKPAEGANTAPSDVPPKAESKPSTTTPQPPAPSNDVKGTGPVP